MSFGDAVHSVLSKYVCFTGRARRSEYWYFQLFVFLVNAVFGVFLTHMEPETRQYALVSILEGVFGLVDWKAPVAVLCGTMCRTGPMTRSSSSRG